MNFDELKKIGKSKKSQTENPTKKYNLNRSKNCVNLEIAMEVVE